MNAPYAFTETGTSRQESTTASEGVESPFISDEVVKRRSRRLFMERFEQAFFVGLLLTLISFTVFIVLSEYSTPSALASSGPLPVSAPEVDSSVRVTWEDEPTFEVPDVARIEDAEVYPIVGEAMDTTWLDNEGGLEELESSPYVEADTENEAVEPVDAPIASATEVEMPTGGVPMEAYLGQHHDGMIEGAPVEVTQPQSEPKQEAETVEKREPVRLGVLRVGGGHPRDLKRLYTDPAVVYGLE